MSSLCFSGIPVQTLMVTDIFRPVKRIVFRRERSAGHWWWTFLPAKPQGVYFSFFKGCHFV